MIRIVRKLYFWRNVYSRWKWKGSFILYHDKRRISGKMVKNNPEYKLYKMVTFSFSLYLFFSLSLSIFLLIFFSLCPSFLSNSIFLFPFLSTYLHKSILSKTKWLYHDVQLFFFLFKFILEVEYISKINGSIGKKKKLNSFLL